MKALEEMTPIFKALLFFFIISCQTLTGTEHPSVSLFYGKIHLQQNNKKVQYDIEIYTHQKQPQIRADILGGFRGVLATFLWKELQGFQVIFPNEKTYINSQDSPQVESKELDMFLKNLVAIHQALQNQAPKEWECHFKKILKKASRFSKTSPSIETSSLPQTCRLNDFQITWQHQLDKLKAIQLELNKDKHTVYLDLKRKSTKHLKQSENHFQIDIPPSFKKITKIDQI